MSDAAVRVPIILDYQESFQQFGQSVEGVFTQLARPHTVHVDAGDASRTLAAAALEVDKLHDTIAEPVSPTPAV